MKDFDLALGQLIEEQAETPLDEKISVLDSYVNMLEEKRDREMTPGLPALAENVTPLERS